MKKFLSNFYVSKEQHPDYIPINICIAIIVVGLSTLIYASHFIEKPNAAEEAAKFNYELSVNDAYDDLYVHFDLIAQFKMFEHSKDQDGTLFIDGNNQCYLSYQTAANNFSLAKVDCGSVDLTHDYQFGVLSNSKLSDLSSGVDVAVIQNLNTNECFLLYGRLNSTALVDYSCKDTIRI